MPLVNPLGGPLQTWLKRTRAPKPVNPDAKHPNKKPGAPTHHIHPTRRPGAGLTGTRKALHKLMVATAGNPFHWTYYEVRPIYLPKRRLTNGELGGPLAVLKATLAKVVASYRSDCSWGVKTLHWLAGCTDDPTGENWGPWGNSSSTYLHLPKRPGLDNAYHPTAAALATCQVGDIGVVGVNGSEHMFAIMEAGPNPLVWSDGGQESPNCYHILDDTRRPISVCIPKGLD